MTQKLINVYSFSGDDYAAQLWEYYYAHKQHIMYPNPPDISISFQKIDKNIDKKLFNVLHVQHVDVSKLSDTECDLYDVIIVDNSIENLSVGNNESLTFIKNNDNVYFLVGSFVHSEYHLYDKCISLPRDWLNCRNWYTNPKVFVSYGVESSKARTNKMVFIGGALRSYRKFLIDELEHTGIDFLQNSLKLECTNDTINGDDFDQQFVDYCNEIYNVGGVTTSEINIFYNVLRFGIPSKPAGQTSISYIVMPEYKEYKCVLYPESSFINHEVYPTEKTWKCVVSKTHWIMFAGKHSYQLMADMGIRSILELTPNGIKFDSIDNHVSRFREMSKSIKYLNNNPEIFDTQEAHDILNTNYEGFLTGNKFIMPMITKLDEILEKHT